MSDTKKFNRVDEYFKSQPENTRIALLALRKCIYKAAPNAIEMINYNIPAYALTAGGKRDQQIMIAGFKKHIGLYPHPAVMAKFNDELREYKKGKGSVQFPLDKPIPEELIVKMIQYRVELLKKENYEQK